MRVIVGTGSGRVRHVCILSRLDSVAGLTRVSVSGNDDGGGMGIGDSKLNEVPRGQGAVLSNQRTERLTGGGTGHHL